MSKAINNFTQQLHDNLEASEDRVKSIQDSIKSASQKTQTEIQLRLDEVKAALEAKNTNLNNIEPKFKRNLRTKKLS